MIPAGTNIIHEETATKQSADFVLQNVRGRAGIKPARTPTNQWQIVFRNNKGQKIWP